MKYTSFLGLFLPVLASAQITVAPQELQFPTTEYGNTDSIEVTLTNNYSVDVNLTAVAFEQVYGNDVFYAPQAPTALNAGQSASFWVYFEPEHNIEHNSEMVILTDYRGAISVDVTGDGEFANSYYDNTFNLSEEDLKSALKTILAAGYNQLGYNIARDNMYGSLDNVSGDVECVYTGRTATFNDRPGANANSFNCEHTFIQSLFGGSDPMVSDIHHLFPTDIQANSERGALAFGVVNGTPSWQDGGSKKGGGVFEPRDVQKGATARAMMYFVTRYQDYSNFFAGQETILRQWHEDFDPNASEIQRNNGIYSLQHNRNPYVDYPQFIERIQVLSGTSVAPQVDSLFISTDTIDLEDENIDLAYRLILCNRGNQAIEVSNFQFSDAAFYFQNTVGTETIEAGESLELIVTTSMDLPEGSIEALTFDTDIQNGTTQTVVLKGGWYPSSIEEKLQDAAFKVYPNPTTAEFTYPVKRNENALVIDANGRLVKTCEDSPCSVRELPAGWYIVKVAEKEALLIKRD
ncbi:MAG: hypothetical protein CL843_01230 [Crocinitomicaceae bacterium]|nr:hypothetical protein [Crocinitomicaceae bacterium]|tara:strand:- start:616 stop:2175 length:1560 start_codon:yes stop_codon:yes gene_type:complete